MDQCYSLVGFKLILICAFFNKSHHFPAGLTCSHVLLLGFGGLQFLTVFCLPLSLILLCPSYVSPSSPATAWGLLLEGERWMQSLSMHSLAQCSEDGELPHLISKLSFVVGSTTVPLSNSTGKPRVYLEYCAQCWPPHSQKDIAELEEAVRSTVWTVWMFPVLGMMDWQRLRNCEKR